MTASKLRHRASVTASVLALVAAAATSAGCSAGLNTQTANQVAAVPGANAQAAPDGNIQLRDLVVAYNGPAGYPVGGAAPLEIRIFNSGSVYPVKLIKVSAGDAAHSVTLVGGSPKAAAAKTSAAPAGTATASTAASSTGSPAASASESATPTPSPTPNRGDESFSLTIPAASYLQLVPGAGPYLQLNGLAKPLLPGQFIAVTFTFESPAAASGATTGPAVTSTVTVNIPVGVPLSPAPRASAS